MATVGFSKRVKKLIRPRFWSPKIEETIFPQTWLQLWLRWANHNRSNNQKKTEILFRFIFFILCIYVQTYYSKREFSRLGLWEKSVPSHLVGFLDKTCYNSSCAGVPSKSTFNRFWWTRPLQVYVWPTDRSKVLWNPWIVSYDQVSFGYSVS